MYWQWGRALKTTHLLLHTTTERSQFDEGFHTYFEDTKKIQCMLVGCLVHSSDIPERQFVTNTRKEGHFRKCSNYFYCVNFDRLPACKECYKENIFLVISCHCSSEYHQCNKCFSWKLIHMIHCKQASPSQRITLWD
jgi:hypothetical protein